MKQIVSAFVIVLCLTQAGQSSWGANGCGPVGPSAFAPMMPLFQMQVQTPAPAPVYWSQQPDGWWRLFQGSACQGAYHPEIGYQPWQGFGQWGAPASCPVAPPVAYVGKKAASKTQAKPSEDEPIAQNFGLDLDKIGKGAGYKINGQSATKAEVMEAIEKGSLADDSKKLRLTVIGPAADRKPVMADLKAGELAALTKDAIVREYDPSHWHVAKAGFTTTGKPSIYYQLPSGKVLHHQDDYEGGAQSLATALRKADPNYDPKKDPDLRKTPKTPNTPTPPGPNVTPNTPAPGVPGALVLIPLALLAAGGAVYLLGKRSA